MHFRRKLRFFALLLIVTVLVFSNPFKMWSGGDFLAKLSGKASGPISSLKEAANAFNPVVTDKLHSPNAILICLDDHTILMQKKGDQKIYPASLTKIMTETIAIENLPDLQKKITLPAPMFQELYKANASMAGFVPNEKVKAADLLYGVMLPSGAECCIGLADHIAGSEQGFVEKMNQKAEQLGMKNTHFTNCTGLHDKNHYTTVKDLSVLLCYALQNETFRDVFTSSRYSTSPTNKHPEGVTFQSTMFKSIENPVIGGGKILGGKTGFTDEAGLCLASLAESNHKKYVLVTAGAKGDHQSEQYNIDDAYEVYNDLGKK